MREKTGRGVPEQAQAQEGEWPAQKSRKERKGDEKIAKQRQEEREGRKRKRGTRG